MIHHGRLFFSLFVFNVLFLGFAWGEELPANERQLVQAGWMTSLYEDIQHHPPFYALLDSLYYMGSLDPTENSLKKVQERYLPFVLRISCKLNPNKLQLSEEESKALDYFWYTLFWLKQLGPYEEASFRNAAEEVRNLLKFHDFNLLKPTLTELARLGDFSNVFSEHYAPFGVDVALIAKVSPFGPALQHGQYRNDEGRAVFEQNRHQGTENPLTLWMSRGNIIKAILTVNRTALAQMEKREEGEVQAGQEGKHGIMKYKDSVGVVTLLYEAFISLETLARNPVFLAEAAHNQEWQMMGDALLGALRDWHDVAKQNRKVFGVFGAGHRVLLDILNGIALPLLILNPKEFYWDDITIARPNALAQLPLTSEKFCTQLPQWFGKIALPAFVLTHFYVNPRAPLTAFVRKFTQIPYLGPHAVAPAFAALDHHLFAPYAADIYNALQYGTYIFPSLLIFLSNLENKVNQLPSLLLDHVASQEVSALATGGLLIYAFGLEVFYAQLVRPHLPFHPGWGMDVGAGGVLWVVGWWGENEINHFVYSYREHHAKNKPVSQEALGLMHACCGKQSVEVEHPDGFVKPSHSPPPAGGDISLLGTGFSLGVTYFVSRLYAGDFGARPLAGFKRWVQVGLYLIAGLDLAMTVFHSFLGTENK